MTTNKPIRDLKLVGMWEGISYLMLLFVAMPLKYMADMPMAVRIVGTAHGVLFMMFIYCIYNAMDKGGISFKKAVVTFVLSIVPFGTFFLDRVLK